ncbi:cytochrome P450 [Saccharothrix carnea]|uniref:Cytochrome P450 n=1 Tax=Saccharothrix carnea TaxID=1280637 RepID=A0A2P8IBU5_SACCR|nr:cytochrome P450 [Saccharothrix carnea]PSL55939.1 cytochrome P450 [Saccharothrix carnea]
MTSQAAPGQACPAHHGRKPLYGPEFAADPAATYQALREHGPVAPVELAPGVPASLVVGYSAALDVLRNPSAFPRDPRRWQAKMPPDSPVLPMMMYRPNCLFTDGAQHARLRAVVTDSLARVDANALRAHVERTADRLIARFAGNGEADLLGEYAQLLPLMMFNHLYGCPPALGDRLVAAMRAIFDMVEPERANAELTQCMLELVALKRQRPDQDMPSWMMAHPARLTDEELIHQLILLMGAGTEPEQNLIANGIRLLLADDRFAGNLSGGSLPVEEALDEVLWTDPPMANYSASYPVEDTDFAGVRLPAAEPVVISFAAANNDPALAGQQRSGNRAHLAWSAGVHSCPAQQPARLIASVAMEKILDALPDMRLAVGVDELVWRPGPFHRALAALPVRFTPVAVPVPSDESPGEARWNAQPTPSSSIPAAVTSTPSPPPSPREGRRPWWSSLARLLRGR